MRPDRDQTLSQAPLSDLLAILLRQHRHLLAERGIELTEAEIRELAANMPVGDSPLRAALIDIVEESLTVLARWDLTFPLALKTDMNALPGWETTAEFLEIANAKSNAELRISSGATLVAALGDWRYGHLLLAAIDHDPAEVDTVTARRVLSLASGIAPDAEDWSTHISQWLNTQEG
jgi:hypothetical protein